MSKPGQPDAQPTPKPTRYVLGPEFCDIMSVLGRDAADDIMQRLGLSPESRDRVYDFIAEREQGQGDP